MHHIFNTDPRWKCHKGYHCWCRTTGRAWPRSGEHDKKLEVERDLKNIDLTSKDVVIGIAASGKTPYVIGGLTFANTIGATTVSIYAMNMQL